jgi:alpha-galactosidase
MYEAYGAYPAVNDRHVCEFFPEQFRGGRYYGRTLGVDVFSFEATIANGDKAYADMRAQARGQAPLDERIYVRAPGEHEQLVDILRCIWADERRVFAANLPNCGSVPWLPDDAILELPAVTTATGLRALPLHEFPRPLTAVLARKLAGIRLTVDAALTGDQDLLVEALLADGAVVERQVAEEMAAELLAAHHTDVPQFDRHE